MIRLRTPIARLSATETMCKTHFEIALQRNEAQSELSKIGMGQLHF